MNWMEFSAIIIGHVAWPIAVLILGVMFQRQIRALLEKLTRLKGPGGIEVDFKAEVQAVAREAEQVVLRATRPEEKASKAQREQSPEFEPGLTAEQRSKIKTHYDSPRFRIVDSYSDVETAMENLIEFSKLPKHTDSKGPGFYAHTLMRAGIIDARTKDVLEQLRDLRDKALRDDVEPTMAEADTFYEAAQGLAQRLRLLLTSMISQKTQDQNLAVRARE